MAKVEMPVPLIAMTPEELATTAAKLRRAGEVEHADELERWAALPQEEKQRLWDLGIGNAKT